MMRSFVVSFCYKIYLNVRILVTILLFLLICLMANGLFAQSGYIPPKVPDKAIRDLDEAVLVSKTGHTAEAVTSIQELITKYPSWTLPRQHLSRIYYEAGHKQESLGTLQSALLIDTASQLQQLYSLAKLYEELGLYDDAIAAYKSVVMRTEEKSPLKTKASDSCQALKSKQSMLVPTYKINAIPFDTLINSSRHEALGRWSLDGSTMIFTRLVGMEDVMYIANHDATNKSWRVAEFPFPVQQTGGAHAISPDGKYFVFTGCNRPDGLGGCDLYISVRHHDGWTNPVNMGPGFNTPSYDGQPSFGVDGYTLYFSSNREGTLGGRDIWYMYQISGDQWSRPINAGVQINTPNNEESPFVHFDGKSIYFMRDGKETLGGYDIYMSRKAIDDNWQTAETLGVPINSVNDEGALSLHPDGRHAIITQVNSARRNDLFQIELPEKFRALPQQALVVHIKDRTTGEPVIANLEIFPATGDQKTRLSQWADATGKITTSLQRNLSYGIIANSPGYLMHSSHMDPDIASSRAIMIEMTPITKATNTSIVLRNVFFETGSAEIKPESDTELNKLLYTLKTNRSMHIEIRGHTDDVGDDAFNLELSKERAKSVYTWLVKKGVESLRLTFKGLGETEPIASNSTDEGRQLNRRTEFLVTGNQ